VKYPDIGELDKLVRVREWQDEPDADQGVE
jgi:hypothetical protein